MKDGDIQIQAGSGSGSVDLEGSQAGLETLASTLKRKQGARLRLSRPPHSPDPYAEWLSFLDIRVEDEAEMTMAVEDGDLVVAGDPSALEILADNLSSFAENPDTMGGHIHIEYFPDHFFLRPGAIPLTVVSHSDDPS